MDKESEADSEDHLNLENDDLAINIDPIDPSQIVLDDKKQDLEDALDRTLEESNPDEIVRPMVEIAEEVPVEVLKVATDDDVNINIPGAYCLEKNELNDVDIDIQSDHTENPNLQDLGTVVVPLQPKYPVDELIPFLTKLAASYQTFGAPANRVEYNMVLCSEAMGIYASYSSMPTSLTITFGSPELLGSVTKSLRIEQSLLECGKMYLLDRLIDKIAKDKITLEDARIKLDQILKRPPHYHYISKICATATSSGAAAGIFFEGGWVEITVAFLVGIIVGIIKHIGSKHRNFNRLSDITASIVSSFISTIIGNLIEGTCISSIILGAIVWLLPGLSLTIAIRELATSNMASGTVRLFNAFLTALKLGFGIAVGSHLPFWIPKSVFATGCDHGLSHWWYILFFVLITISFNVLLDTNSNLWPGLMCTSAISFCTSYVCKILNVPGDITPSIAAFGVGIAGNLISRFTDVPGVIFIFSGILMLVPGSIGVQSVVKLLNKDMQSGVEVGFQMIVVGLSITVGTFVANLIIIPKRSLVNRLY